MPFLDKNKKAAYSKIYRKSEKYKAYRKSNKYKIYRKAYNKKWRPEYRSKNKEKFSIYAKQYVKKHRVAVVAYQKIYSRKRNLDIGKSLVNWIKCLLHRTYSRKYKISIKVDDLLKLYKQQKGLCALTHVPMKYCPNNLKSMSIDRIDSSIGYTKDNIQLVCKWVNLAKNTHSNDDMIKVLNEYLVRNR